MLMESSPPSSFILRHREAAMTLLQRYNYHRQVLLTLQSELVTCLERCINLKEKLREERACRLVATLTTERLARAEIPVTPESDAFSRGAVNAPTDETDLSPVSAALMAIQGRLEQAKQQSSSAPSGEAATTTPEVKGPAKVTESADPLNGECPAVSESRSESSHTATELALATLSRSGSPVQRSSAPRTTPQPSDVIRAIEEAAAIGAAIVSQSRPPTPNKATPSPAPAQIEADPGAIAVEALQRLASVFGGGKECTPEAMEKLRAEEDALLSTVKESVLVASVNALPDYGTVTLEEARERSVCSDCLTRLRRNPTFFRAWKRRLVFILDHVMLLFRESAKKRDVAVERRCLPKCRGECADAAFYGQDHVMILRGPDDVEPIVLAFASEADKMKWIKYIKLGQRTGKLQAAKAVVRERISTLTGSSRSVEAGDQMSQTSLADTARAPSQLAPVTPTAAVVQSHHGSQNEETFADALPQHPSPVAEKDRTAEECTKVPEPSLPVPPPGQTAAPIAAPAVPQQDGATVTLSILQPEAKPEMIHCDTVDKKEALPSTAPTTPVPEGVGPCAPLSDVESPRKEQCVAASTAPNSLDTSRATSPTTASRPLRRMLSMEGKSPKEKQQSMLYLIYCFMSYYEPAKAAAFARVSASIRGREDSVLAQLEGKYPPPPTMEGRVRAITAKHCPELESELLAKLQQCQKFSEHETILMPLLKQYGPER